MAEGTDPEAMHFAKGRLGPFAAIMRRSWWGTAPRICMGGGGNRRRGGSVSDISEVQGHELKVTTMKGGGYRPARKKIWNRNPW